MPGDRGDVVADDELQDVGAGPRRWCCASRSRAPRTRPSSRTLRPSARCARTSRTTGRARTGRAGWTSSRCSPRRTCCDLRRRGVTRTPGPGRRSGASRPAAAQMASTRPVRTSTIPLPPSSPGNHACTSAEALAAISGTAWTRPLTSTTTVGVPVATTRVDELLLHTGERERGGVTRLADRGVLLEARFAAHEHERHRRRRRRGHRSGDAALVVPCHPARSLVDDPVAVHSLQRRQRRDVIGEVRAGLERPAPTRRQQWRRSVLVRDLDVGRVVVVALQEPWRRRLPARSPRSTSRSDRSGSTPSLVSNTTDAAAARRATARCSRRVEDRGRRGRVDIRMLEEPEPELAVEHPPHGAVDDVHGHRTVEHLGLQRRAVAVGGRQFDVETRR